MSTDYPAPAKPGEGEPVVFLDVTLGGEPLGRITLHLFSTTHSRTSENFRQFCTGEHRDPRTNIPQGYKSCKFHRVIRSFMIQAGDFLHTTTPSLLGTGSTSIYHNAPFADESFRYAHGKPGLLSMANSGPDTNGCQFFITCAPARGLDGKHVVFGQVVGGMEVVRMIENVRVVGERPAVDVRIAQCGEL